MTEIDAVRGRVLVEESPEILAILDNRDLVVACSRRARVEGIERGQPLPARFGMAESVAVTYAVAGATERLVYFGVPGNLAAYEELRSGFTAAVSHELRTPLARLLVLLETMELPGADVAALTTSAQSEVAQARELIDEVLFLSQLESGEEVVSLGTAPTLPVLHSVAAELADRADRAGIHLSVEGSPNLDLPLRERMQRVIAGNLVENAIQYAGAGSTVSLSVKQLGDETVLSCEDNGTGVSDADLPRLFERFYRADRVRSSRGTGLGLAIVKHITVAGGGRVEAGGAPGGGLVIRCRFPVSPSLL